MWWPMSSCSLALSSFGHLLGGCGQEVDGKSGGGDGNGEEMGLRIANIPVFAITICMISSTVLPAVIVYG